MYQLEPAEIDFKDDGMPVSRLYGDIYFQPTQGAAEADYVFLQGNGLYERFSGGREFFNILELGFGTGLNFVLTFALFLRLAEARSHLTYVAIEKHPLRKEDMRRVAALFPEMRRYFDALMAFDTPFVKGRHVLRVDARVTLILCYGDILELLPDINGQFDAIYADGFAPAKNGAMWTEEVIKALPALCYQGTRLATFTAAGAVRRALMAEGFEVMRQKGFGHKREMIIAQFLQGAPKKTALPKAVRIVGAGISGLLCAEHLARYGIEATVFEKAQELGAGASGNDVGAVYPKLTAGFSHYGDLQLMAFLYAVAYYKDLGLQEAGLFTPCGVALVAEGEEDLGRYQKIAGLFSDKNFCDFYDAHDLSRYAGAALPCGGLFYPIAGKMRPKESLRFLQQKYDVRLGAPLVKQKEDEALITIMTMGAHLKQALPMRAEMTRGQISVIARPEFLKAQRAVICHQGYVIDDGQGQSYMGASYERCDEMGDFELRATDHAENIRKLNALCSDDALRVDLTALKAGRTGYRLSAYDRLPYVGRYGGEDVQAGASYVLGALGSHGLTLAPVLAASLVAEILHLPLPMSDKRYQKLQVKRGMKAL